MFNWLLGYKKMPTLNMIGQPLHMNPVPGDNYTILRHLKRINTLKQAMKEKGCSHQRKASLKAELTRRVKALSFVGLELNWHDDVAIQRLMKDYGG